MLLAVDLSRMNILRGTEAAVLPLKSTTSSPRLFYMEVPPSLPPLPD